MPVTNYYHVTPSGAGSKNGTTWTNAFDLSGFHGSLLGGTAGDVYWIADGTYTLSGNINFSAINGSLASPISMIGVKASTTNSGFAVTYNDWAINTADKPFFNFVTYTWTLGTYYNLRNLQLQTITTNALNFGNFGLIENCKLINANTASDSAAYIAYTPYAAIINSEITGTYGRGINAGYCTFMYNYVHGFSGTLGIGFYMNTPNNFIANNIFQDIKLRAIGCDDNNRNVIINNTFYNCATDIYQTTGGRQIIMNNIHEASDSYGIISTTQTDSNFIWREHGDDARCTDIFSGIDVTGCYQDYFVTAGDPLFVSVTAGSEDFNIDAASPCIDTGETVIGY